MVAPSSALAAASHPLHLGHSEKKPWWHPSVQVKTCLALLRHQVSFALLCLQVSFALLCLHVSFALLCLQVSSALLSQAQLH